MTVAPCLLIFSTISTASIPPGHHPSHLPEKTAISGGTSGPGGTILMVWGSGTLGTPVAQAVTANANKIIKNPIFVIFFISLFSFYFLTKRLFLW
jgi:hypothetical protein